LKTLVFLFLIIPIISLSQAITEDFEDGELTNWYQSRTGHWVIAETDAGNDDKILVHSYNDSLAGSDWISLLHEPINLNEECVWKFLLRYDHSPSANNRWAVFLTDNEFPDQEDKISNGIIMAVNYMENTDELKLWKVTDGECEALISTGFNWEENIAPKQIVAIEIQKEKDGDWVIHLPELEKEFFGKTMAGDFAEFNTYTLFYKYTASKDCGLAIDDLILEGSINTDTVPPHVISINVIDPWLIEVSFTEIVFSDAQWECCVRNIGCGFVKFSGNSFTLSCPNPLNPGETYTLELPCVSDNFGNSACIGRQSIDFYYQKAGDIVINEVMADPTPQILLPDAEYIELLNTSDQEISLKNWLILINGNYFKLPEFLLHPDQIVLIADTCFNPNFDTIIRVITSPELPQIANSEAVITLHDRSGKLIHALYYDEELLKRVGIEFGGRSLEMINPFDPCIIDNNISVSLDFKGGTPGEKNSVYKSKEYIKSPELWRVAITETGTLMLYFSEPLDSLTSDNQNFYTVDHSIGNPDSIKHSWPFNNQLELYFKNRFHSEIEYELTITSDICDCSGKILNSGPNGIFKIPVQADSADIIINEIMFQPESGYEEYIELFNRSDHEVDLRNFSLIKDDSEDTILVTNEYWPLSRGSYAIIARSFSNIDKSGIFENANRIILMKKMPTLINSGSRIKLLRDDKKVVEMINYYPNIHHSIIEDIQGVSLERLSPEASGLNPYNWHSASSDADYMTPAAPNSQKSITESECDVTINKKIITPDGNGIDDGLIISYCMNKPGYMGVITVFDTDGNECYRLGMGVLLGTEGTFRFDGRSDNGNPLPTGNYILFFYAYTKEGETYKAKRTFAIAPL
jgi:hypothetical protein